MKTAIHSLTLVTVFSLLLLCAAAQAQIGPAQEQELADANAALETARKAQAEKYASAEIKKAQASLQAVNEARVEKDALRFSQSARVVCAYAELALALSELGMATDKLTTSNLELQKTKADIASLKKSK